MGSYNSIQCEFCCCQGLRAQGNQNSFQFQEKRVSNLDKKLDKVKQEKQVKFSLISLTTANSNKKMFLLDKQIFILETQRPNIDEINYVDTANYMYEKGNLQQAINNYMLALHKVDRRDIKTADIHYIIGQCYFTMKNFSIALKHCKLAQTKYAQLMGKTSDGVAMSCSLLGKIMTESNDYVLGQHYYQKAYRIYRQQQSSNLIEVGLNLAALYLNLDFDDKALQIYQQIQNLFSNDSEALNNSTMVQLYRCLGITCFKLSLYERCNRYFQKAFLIQLSFPSLQKDDVEALVRSFFEIKSRILATSQLNQSKLTSQTLKYFQKLCLLVDGIDMNS